MYDGYDDVARAWRDGLTPDPFLDVSEWADRDRVLSSTSSSEPGRWRTARTPYLRDIMNDLSPASATERVVFMKGAQVGGCQRPAGYQRRALAAGRPASRRRAEGKHGGRKGCGC